MNGLPQTEDSMRALLGMRRPLLDEETIEQRVAARLARQDIFDRWPAPLLSFVSEAPVLRRQSGGPGISRASWRIRTTARYGIIRSRALSPDETTGFIENLLEQP